MFLEDFSRRRRARARQQEIAESIQYRQSMRRVADGQRRIRALIDDYKARAVAAEQQGCHDRAVRLALEANRLERYLASSGGISAAVESAHAVTTANRAFADVLAASGGLVEQAARMADPMALSEAQAGMMAVSEDMKLMMEQSDSLLEGLEDDAPRENETGEALLRDIMASEHREKRGKLYEDTRKQLDRLQRARAAEK